MQYQNQDKNERKQKVFYNKNDEMTRQ